MSQGDKNSDVDRLCALLFLKDPLCQKSNVMFCNVISTVIGINVKNIIESVNRLLDKNLEDQHVALFHKYENGLLDKDNVDFKVMLCIAFASNIDLNKIIGRYQLDVLTIVADMTKDQVEQAIIDAKNSGFIEMPSKGNA